MTDRGMPLRRLGFLTIGQFDPADPGRGHEQTLRMIVLAEALGFDSVVGAPAPSPARHLLTGRAAGRREPAHQVESHWVLPSFRLGWKTRYASPRIWRPSTSCPRAVSTPVCPSAFRCYTNTSRPPCIPRPTRLENFSKERVLRLLACLRGEPVSDFAGMIGQDDFSNRVQPHSPGLAGRVWYGGGRQSAEWAGTHGMNYLTANLVTTEGTDSRDFATIQAEHIDIFRRHHPDPESARVAQGLVVIPTDSASANRSSGTVPTLPTASSEHCSLRVHGAWSPRPTTSARPTK